MAIDTSRARRAALLGAAALLLVAASSPTTTIPRGPRSAQAQVQAAEAETAAQLNTSKASISQIDAALQTLTANAATQSAALAKAEAEVATARAAEARARRTIRRLGGQEHVLRIAMRERAVNAYVYPPTDDLLVEMMTNDFNSASERAFYIGLRSRTDAGVARKLVRTQDQLARERRRARAAERKAAAEQARQQRALDATQLAQLQRHDLLARLRTTIAEQTERSIELAATDRALAAQLATQQALLSARLTDPGATDTGTSTATGGDTESADGGETGPLVPGEFTGTGPEGIKLCTVGGITVNCIIKDQLAFMLFAAAKDHITLSGGGFRDPAEQVALRRAHCGSSFYAIYQAPASSCSPPTARPGTSQHEVGLAIDFAGASSHGTPVWQWLNAHAATFGFYNLPSEAWHWSTSGS